MTDYQTGECCPGDGPAVEQAAQPGRTPPPGSVDPGRGRFLRLPRVAWWRLPRLWWGKVRRAVLARATGYTRRRHELRRGQCLRCGACCQLGYVCRSLVIEPSGLAACVKYDMSRHSTCRVYPTTCTDLRDRDLIRPGAKCGYYFSDR